MFTLHVNKGCQVRFQDNDSMSGKKPAGLVYTSQPLVLIMLVWRAQYMHMGAHDETLPVR